MDEEARTDVSGLTEAARAIADSLGVGAAVDKERAISDLRREEGLAEARRDAMMDIVASWRSEVSQRSVAAEHAVRRVFMAAESQVRARLAKSPTMPAGINYVDRYDAFVQMEDSRELVKRLEQTLVTADKVIARIARVDAKAALANAAATWEQLVAPLADVRVGESGAVLAAAVAGPVETDSLRRFADLRAREADAVAAAVEEAFARHTPDDLMDSVARRNHDELETARETEAAVVDATHAVDERRRAMSREVAGSALSAPNVGAIVTSAVVEDVYPPEELARLAAAVRESFAIYRRVVNDQGVFGAFSREDKDVERGMPDGRAWAMGRSSEMPVDLPTMVEVKGKETLPEVIERMEAFNRRPYRGIFDDDFAEHVEAFWYGFGRLMAFCNTAVRVDTGRFFASLAAAQAPVLESAETLGSLMDYEQLADFQQRLRRIEEEIG